MSDAPIDGERAATASPAPSVAPTAPGRRPRRALRWAAGSVAALVVAVALLVAGLWWAVNDATGTRWLAGLVPHTTLVHPKGSLLGDFSADRIDIALGTDVLRLEAPRWHALGARQGTDGRWLGLTIETLHVDRAVWVSGPAQPGGGPPTPPGSLRLPIEIEVRDASIGELRWGLSAGAAAFDLRGRIHLGADGGRTHRFDDLSARYDRARGAGRFAIGADAPLQVDAALALAATDPSLPWQVAVLARGPLAALAVTASVRQPDTAAHAAQRLDARATVKPFASWPLGDVDLVAQALDLSAFTTALPATSLSGKALARSDGLDRPASLSVELANARAGRWNEGLLPVQRAIATLHVRPDDPTTLDVESLRADLGTARLPGGVLDGTGRWAPSGWTLTTTLAGVRPFALDASAPDAVLAGTVKATGHVDAASGATHVDVSAQVAGPLADARLPRKAARGLQLRFEAHASPLAIDVPMAEARLGDSRASLAGKLSRKAVQDPWRATGKVSLAGFDPAPWWPGQTAFAGVASHLEGSASVDVVLTPPAPNATALDRLLALVGQAHVTLADSVLAGVPVSGDLGATRAAGGAAQLDFTLLAGGNRATGTGRFGGPTHDDRWRLVVDAPQLARLAPLLGPSAQVAPVASVRPVESASARAALAGSLALHAEGSGSWPDVTTRGDLKADALRFRDVTIDKATGHWQAGTARGAPLDAELVVDGASQSGRRVEQARLALSGTAGAHKLTARIDSAALPPEWADLLSAEMPTESIARPGPASARSTLALSAEGGLVDVGDARAAGWRGRIDDVVAQAATGPQRVWLRAHDLHGQLFWSGGAARASLEPGALTLLGAGVRWSRFDWQAADAATGSQGHLDAQATVDPLPLAPILRRLQPDFGWGGDLAVGARVDVRSSPAVTADVVIERARGDLTVTDEYGSEPLGLSDLRLALTARDGVWRAAAALAGARLGSASAAITARVGRAVDWPAPTTPIEGVLELRIAQLGNWGRWVPAGWRVSGALHASARIGGRLGAPEYTGHVEGSGLGVRNFVEGVNVVDGDLAIALQGETARIEHFTAHAGKGSVELTGSAVIGAAPTAQVQLRADHFELLGRVDRRIVTSGSGALRLTADSIGLDGNFKVDEGLVDFTRSDAPSLGSDVEVVRRPIPPAPGTTVASGSAPLPTAAAASASAGSTVAEPAIRKVALDLRVALGDALRIRGRGIDSGLRGELHLTAPSGRLAVDGTLTTAEGTYQAYGQKLSIDRGVLAFSGAVDNPRLDIEATRPDIDVRAGVLVSGTALNPRVRLFSEPDMSDLDKLSWLVLGRASDSSGGRADTALLQQAALGLLSGEGPGVTDRLTHAIGLDAISLRQQSEGDTKETIVSLGKQISKRWYVGYERGLNGTTGNWQLIYRLAQRITVRAQAGSDSAVDLIWTLRWK